MQIYGQCVLVSLAVAHVAATIKQLYSFFNAEHAFKPKFMYGLDVMQMNTDFYAKFRNNFPQDNSI